MVAVGCDTFQGFPGWLRVEHYVNFFFMILLIRSGLQILADHPRLYWNNHCTPGSEWLRFTKVKEIPRDRVWTAVDDAVPLTSWIGLPGGRHKVGLARHWHFLCVIAWIANGLAYVSLLFATGQWRRLVPTSWDVFPGAWHAFVNYVTFAPLEENAFLHYNPLQQLTYFVVVLVLAPATIMTGAAMSPAIDARLPWYPRIFGGRQAARSIHFLLMAAWVAFVCVHVALVALTGLARNMNHIVLGTDGAALLGIALGSIGIGVVVGANVLANVISWRRPRLVQHASRVLTTPLGWLIFSRLTSRQEYRKEEISPYFWVNGEMPTSREWTELAAHDFRDYRLEVHGLVEAPRSLSLDELRAMGKKTQITLHHCIQGWSGIAEWGGLPVAELLKAVKPLARARYLVFRSFAEGLEGGQYYDTLSLALAALPQTLLAYEMNFARLPSLHGAPLRLRVETVLGFKMVKWIRSIELVEDDRAVGEGEGGYQEDRLYFGSRAEI